MGVLGKRGGGKKGRDLLNERPAPASVAQVGPFNVKEAPSDYGRSQYVFAGKEGLFQVPLTNDAASLAVRAHEYGHLALHAEFQFPPDVLQLLKKKGISEDLAQAGLDAVVEVLLNHRGVAEIQQLPLAIPNKEILEQTGFTDLQIAEILLRSTGLDEARIADAQKLVQMAFESYERGVLQRAQWAIVGIAEHMHRVPSFRGVQVVEALSKQLLIIQALLEEIEEKAKRAGKTEEKDDEDDTDSVLKALGMTEDEDNLFPMTPAGMALRETTGARWGRMEIVSPGKRISWKAKRARKVYRPGFHGAFRYPIRALLPAFDGSAFGVRRKIPGGTVLLDLSGSMGLSHAAVEAMVKAAPGATVAGYASRNDDISSGRLVIFAEQGKMVEDVADARGHYLGHGNIVDGPALQWLLRQKAPRIWVSDGMVTGKDECQNPVLELEVHRLVKLGRVTWYKSMREFFEKEGLKEEGKEMT